jgi:hypothetical protein
MQQLTAYCVTMEVPTPNTLHYYAGIWVHELRKTMKNLSGSWFLGSDLNQWPPEFEGVQTILLQHFIQFLGSMLNYLSVFSMLYVAVNRYTERVQMTHYRRCLCPWKLPCILKTHERGKAWMNSEHGGVWNMTEIKWWHCKGKAKSKHKVVPQLN